METISGYLNGFFALMNDRFWSLVDKPFDSSSRLFWLYIVSGALIAFFVYRLSARTAKDTPSSFLGFLFPRKVWQTKSAWLDLRYFVVNHFLGKLLYISLAGGTMILAYGWVTGGDSLLEVVKASEMPDGGDVIISILYMFVVVALVDLTAYSIHYLQHRVPILWEFHKVHHSPEVMHPISNFREHPFDNVAYTIGVGLVTGLIVGGVNTTLGYLPNMPVLLGAPLMSFLFNLGGYHLRHSHIWLRWPGRWSMVFPSPAHHHVHHSCHPDHLDKNFAFIFPLWDVLFKTYHMPDDDRDVKFGIHGAAEDEYTSIWRLYTIPFRNIYRKLKAGKPLTIAETPREDDKAGIADTINS
ncbi:sterol desaturase family protein [Yoonia sp. 2307UL14-13]|uniref:sterol desaturase family protein n=1 Tax=Yoonia sp. 2307UL14-13 TaxID=3126506 RepID=UPI00309E3F95